MTQTVIFCGGRGTRLWPNTEEGNKHMVEIGERPILWHLMKFYSHQGFKEFILCLGLHGDTIKEYFQNPKNKEKDWKIIFAETEPDTLRGGRLKMIEKHIKYDDFFVTYGDGLADIDLKKLLNFHKTHGKMATLTAVKPESQFGIVLIDELDKHFRVMSYREKPVLDRWVSGGFFVFNKKIFDHLTKATDLENELLHKLAIGNQISAFKHEGFWKCMDTFKDVTYLNDLWTSAAPWAIWKK